MPVFSCNEPYAEGSRPLARAIQRVNFLLDQNAVLSQYCFLLRGPPADPSVNIPDDTFRKMVEACHCPDIPGTPEEIGIIRDLLKDGIEILTRTPEMYNGTLALFKDQDEDYHAFFKEGDEFLLGWYPRRSNIWDRTIFINSGVRRRLYCILSTAMSVDTVVLLFSS